jgi:hypothetical protein
VGGGDYISLSTTLVSINFFPEIILIHFLLEIVLQTRMFVQNVYMTRHLDDNS